MRKLVELENGKKVFVDPKYDFGIFYGNHHNPWVTVYLHYTVKHRKVFYIYYVSNNVTLYEVVEPERALRFILDNWGGEFTSDDIKYYKQFFPFLTRKLVEKYYKEMIIPGGE